MLLTLPDICLQLKRLVDSPQTSVADITGLIGKDPALTARLLKIVNCSLYNFPRPVSSVSQAITLVGTRKLYELSLATSAAAIIRTAGGGYLEMKTLWVHSVYTGILSRCILHHVGNNGESAFVSGLLADIGRLAIVKSYPEIAMNAVGTAKKGQFPWQREKEVLGYHLSAVSGELLEAWHLPTEITVPVRFQHDPLVAQQHVQECCALHVGIRLAFELVQDELHDELEYRKTIQEQAVAELSLSSEDIDTIMLQAQDIAPEMLQIFTF